MWVKRGNYTDNGTKRCYFSAGCRRGLCCGVGGGG